MKSAIRMMEKTHQKEFVRLFEGCQGKYGRWESWSDFITLTAISISNTVDKVHEDKREKIYLSIAAKHSKKEMDAFAEMYAETVLGLEENPDQDFLGELFMQMQLGNDHNGQFFTPYHVCKFMSAIATTNLEQEIVSRGWIGVADHCCGAGALLIAFANECLRQDVNYQTSVLFVAQDIDYITGLMCYIQLSLMGCPGYVVIDNTLTHPSTSYDDRGLLPRDNGNVWYTPFYFRSEWHWRRLAAQMSVLFKCEPPAAEQVPDDVKAEPVPEQPLKPKKGSRSAGKKKKALPAPVLKAKHP